MDSAKRIGAISMELSIVAGQNFSKMKYFCPLKLFLS